MIGDFGTMGRAGASAAVLGRFAPRAELGQGRYALKNMETAAQQTIDEAELAAILTESVSA
jgi:hypothetical protein